MNLGEAVAAELPAMRAAAESRMRETCRVRSNPDAGEFDSEANQYVDATPTYSYRGRCRVKAGTTRPRESDAVGRPFVEQQPEVHFPVPTSAGIRIGHVIEILASENDSDLVTARFRVTGRFHQTDATARRLPVEETT